MVPVKYRDFELKKKKGISLSEMKIFTSLCEVTGLTSPQSEIHRASAKENKFLNEKSY